MTQIKTVSIRGKNYVEVAERVRLVHEQQREFEVVESQPYEIADHWLWRVVVLVGGKRYTGNAEVKLNAPKNTPDGTNPFECAETSALGRALAFAGFGSVESIASADEVIRAQSAQQQSDQDTKDRLNALYSKALALGLFQRGVSKQEAASNFLMFTCEVLGEEVSRASQLDATRLDTLEKYIGSQEAA